MNAKTVALNLTFVALAILLNPAITGIGIPFPPLPSLIFNVWEIVIIAAFLLMGFKSGISVALLNSLFLFAVYPGPTQSIYAFGNTIAVASMMVGTYFAFKLADRSSSPEKASSETKKIALSTVFAAIFRIIVMAPIMYAILHYGVLPQQVPDQIIIGIVLPLQALYNSIIALYTVPAGFLLAKVISRNLKVGNKI